MKPRDEMLTITQVAERLGYARNTLTGYRAKGLMPAPDEQFGRTPLWKASTIDAWQAARPRAGKQ